MKTYTFQSLHLTFCLAACLCCHLALAQNQTFYPGLEKGKYDIGYKTLIDFDFSRTYKLNYPNDSISTKHDPRPIITTIWYPAKIAKKDKAMVYGDYIKIQTPDASLKTFIQRIEDYNAKNSSIYMFFKDSLKEEQKKQFTKQLSLPVNVFKNASPMNGKFPLVIYHAGLSGTLNDNTVLCEYLASHGFVVVTGAFQSNNYKSMKLDWDLERSTKDLDFMLNTIKDLPFIDFSKIAAIGHSYGAQAVLAYRTENSSPVSSLIIIDSTIDYSFEASPGGFERLTEKLYRKIKNLNVPMLVFANQYALFKVIDSLKYSDRIYCTIDLEHNDFTSLTSLARKNGLVKQNTPDSSWAKYTLVARYCLNYLKYTIFDDQSANQFLLKDQPFAIVYQIPKGSDLLKITPDYSDHSKPPSYLQLHKLVVNKKTDILDKMANLHPDYLDEELINNTGYSVLNSDLDFAIYLFKINVNAHPVSWNVWDSLGEGYMLKGEKQLAIASYKKSLELNPENTNGLKMLEELNK